MWCITSKMNKLAQQNIMFTSFCTLADRYQHSSGSTGNCPYTSCCTFRKQIPNIFQAHWYQHLHFASSCSGVSTSILHFLPHLFIVTSLHWNWWKLMAVLAISSLEAYPDLPLAILCTTFSSAGSIFYPEDGSSMFFQNLVFIYHTK